MTDQIDELLKEIQQMRGDNKAVPAEAAQPPAPPAEHPAPAEEPSAPAQKPFHLSLDLDREFGDYTPSASESEPKTREPVHTKPAASPAPRKAASTQADKPRSGWLSRLREASAQRENAQYRGLYGCLKWVIYATIVLLAAGILSYFAIVGIIDVSGLNKSDVVVSVTIPSGSTTADIAEILRDNGLIDHPMIFRLYSRFAHSDGLYQPGTFELYPHMGYDGLIEALQVSQSAETVWVTIPEGFTVDRIAARLEESGVCTAEEFCTALLEGEYDYAFLSDIPTVEEDGEVVNRLYQLEGYLFPSTYNFYVNDDAENVVNRMLQAFDDQIGTGIRTAIKAEGFNMDEAVILASLIQGEAASFSDMQGVARVLLNRLENAAEYPKLELDSTRDFVQEAKPPIDGRPVIEEAYNTYVREGLPVGAINNPGRDAFEALAAPSEDEEIMECFFFATDYDTGITYFSKTYAQHERVCREHGIGMYG